MKSRKQFWIVICFITLAFILRVYKLPTDLLFHRDQGLVAMDIYHQWHDGDISLIGAPSDVDGIVHSAIYYWMLLPFYALSGGNVVVPAIFQIFLESISLLFLYLGVKKIFNEKTALLTIVIYAISYGMISYSKWFITVPFILPLTNILIYLLALQYKKPVNYIRIFITSLLVGQIIQTNAAVGVFIVPFLMYFYKQQIRTKSIAAVAAGITLPAVPLIVFQLRHDFVTLKAIYTFVFGNSGGVGFGVSVFWDNLVIFLREVNHSFLHPLYVISTALFIWGIYKIYSNKYKTLVYSYLLIPFLFLGLFQRGAISFFYIAALPVVISVVSYGILKLPTLLKYLTVVIIIIFNLNNLQYLYKPTNALIPIGDENLITLQDRKNIIDWMYQKAHGKEFSVWIYTLPYFQDYPWNYLFVTYAKDKYSYQPEQTSSFSPGDLKTSELFFNIYEPDPGNQSRLNAWFNEVNLNFGTVVDEYQSNDIYVQLREWNRMDL